jgi:hypothetical protein
MRIDDKTTVNLFAALGAAVAIVYASSWLYSVRADASDGKEAKTLYQKIDKRLDRIEIKLGTKPKEEE